ncbi:hypothetical protein LMH73_015240 [Vibrio splendidus]|nr:hypothetical protein [Vibrio splendidus]MCC4882873.1 hypothetical protein [Vibrio splendidus]
MKKINAVLLASLMATATLSPSAVSAPKYKELTDIDNRIFLSSAALSISDFEYRSNGGYEKISMYSQMYSDTSGMLNYESGVGLAETVKGLIIVYLHKERIYVYYNGKFAYSAYLDDSTSSDYSSHSLGTQLFAISNYRGVEID